MFQDPDYSFTVSSRHWYSSKIPQKCGADSSTSSYHKISLTSQILSQPAFTCSKLTIGTLEQGVKYVQI